MRVLASENNPQRPLTTYLFPLSERVDVSGGKTNRGQAYDPCYECTTVGHRYATIVYRYLTSLRGHLDNGTLFATPLR